MSTQANNPVLEAHIELLRKKYDHDVAGDEACCPPTHEEDVPPEDVVPDYEQRLRQVAVRVFSDPAHFDMDTWEDRGGSNDCNTTRCMAGWAVTLAGPQGAELYDLFDGEWGSAGAVLLGCEAARHFADTNREAFAYLRQFLPPDNPFAQEPEPLPSIESL